MHCPFKPEEIKDYLEGIITEYPVCEYAFGKSEDITLSDKIFTICETDCKRYGHSWACPPHAGTIEENIERLKKYENFMLFSTVWDVEDAWDTEACLAVKKEHEALTREMKAEIYRHFDLETAPAEAEDTSPIYFLSSGCTMCETCACPDEPCRHPGERLMSMESHGILMLKLLEDLSLTGTFDSKSVVYFSMILF